ncbi:vWA domain-containing protein [Nannocystis pusilla]|uniref:VWA domain-containing protein n=1 Tax=Nannocystis pusilla TaxID=889268 RepID=A0ABS7TRD5_9BACT|nr:vWA domain-containing protein [Nannocystis pusilla]MBZ5710789.1 VWA domain-containing protein [Nannocystis pusilla]
MCPRPRALTLLASLVCLPACGDSGGRTEDTSASGILSLGSISSDTASGSSSAGSDPSSAGSGGETESTPTSGEPTGTSAGTTPADPTTGTTPKLDVGSVETSGVTTDDTGEICRSISEEAKQTYEPVDIVFAVDTSGSMVDEVAQVQANINSFSQQIVDSGIDVHVVMLAGDPFLILPGICVPAPLGSGMCPADTKLPNYFHYSQPTPPGPIESVDGARKLIELFPVYKPHLRPGVRKYVVIVTDDDSRNHPDSSGDAGIYNNNPGGFIADYTAIDPMMSDGMGNRMWRMSGIYAYSACANSAQVGQVWQDIVTTTGGVSGDICNCSFGNPACTPTFQAVFDELATKIIQGSEPLACQWQIPEPPMGETLDPDYVNVEFLDQGVGVPETIYHVDNAADCDPLLGGWYYDDNNAPKNIILCPLSCGKVSAAPEGSKINLLFGCKTEVIPG